MKQYHNLVRDTLINGSYKPNRTGVDTISSFSQHYEIDLQKGFPLLTTKDLSGFRWNSLKHEFMWYLSGEEHIRNLRDETSIWDAWANEEGELDTAYGRFWRRYPIPDYDKFLKGETWVTQTDGKWTENDDINPNRWITEETVNSQLNTSHTFDQLQYVIDMLNENPNSRRLVVSAWHPGNATVSTLPPCHYSFIFNVQGDKLNCHLTQRSGDIALGIPFNIAAYSLLTHVVAMETDFEVGKFAHTVVDAHIYCGKNDRGKWYNNHLTPMQRRLEGDRKTTESIREWILSNAPTPESDEGYDHVPNLLKQIERPPKDRPEINIDAESMSDLTAEDISIEDYNPHSGLNFEVAE